MIIRCKNTYGDGRVEYIDYEVEVTDTEDSEADAADYEEALGRFGV